jgi:hypothetical protein
MDPTLIASPIVGGLMASVSQLFTGVTNYFTAKQKFKERELEMGHEARMFPLKLEAQKESSAWLAFSTSLESAKAIPDNVHPLASTAVTLTRPTLTLLSLLLSALAEYGRWPNALIIHETTGVIVGWWFGSRQIGKSMTK